jgi:hypothetical protein
MRITNKGLTIINGALDWADMFAGSSDWSPFLEDVDISHAPCARKPWSVFLYDLDILGEGDTFEEAAEEFYRACKAANESAFDE